MTSSQPQPPEHSTSRTELPFAGVMLLQQIDYFLPGSVLPTSSRLAYKNNQQLADR